MGQNATLATGEARTRFDAEHRRAGTSERRAIAELDLGSLPYRRKTSVPVALLVGFVAGSVFWHFVGFWDFVGRIVFHKPKAAPAITGPVRSGTFIPKAAEHLTTVAALGHGAVALGGDAAEISSAAMSTVPLCTTLVRDTATGSTTSTACPAGTVPERFGVVLSRGDLARSADGVRPRTPADEPVTRTVPLGWSTVTSSAP